MRVCICMQAHVLDMSQCICGSKKQTFKNLSLGLESWLSCCLSYFSNPVFQSPAHTHHGCTGAQGSQKRMSRPLELELKVSVTHLAWLLGTKVRSSARAVYSLNHCIISPVPWNWLIKRFSYFILYVWVFCPHVCLCAMCTPHTCCIQKRGCLIPWNLLNVGAGKWARVLFKSSKCS